MGLASTYTQNGRFSDTGALYGAALLSPQAIKTGHQDLWGNVKIPSLETLNSSKADSGGWVEVPASISTPETFSSLVGLPLVNLPSEGISR